LVLDEADRMVQQGHFVELVNILQKLPQPKEKYESTSTQQLRKLNYKTMARMRTLEEERYSAISKY
jgi:superfamily II DNA/RNA helicase